jgi:hypothetical protein
MREAESQQNDRIKNTYGYGKGGFRMVKAKAGNRAYYIYAKAETRRFKNGIDDAVKQTAQVTHERTDRLDVLDAKLIGNNADGLAQYEIGTVGDYYAITRR